MARLILLATAAAFIPGNPAAQLKAEKPKMHFWAALGCQTPIYDFTKKKPPNGITLEFMIVNDGPKKADPQQGDSVILVDGKPLKDSFWIMNNGLFPADPSLEHGEVRRLSRSLGDALTEPGIHKLIWKGASFESPELTIRILGPRSEDS